jgi:predicted nucleic acid-binding protein
VDRGLILETTVLVDLDREAAQGEDGPAGGFLDTVPDARLCITFITAGELACGPKLEDRTRWAHLLGRFEILEPTNDAAWRYGQTFRYLRDNGLSIGTNDLWIAATALAHDLPVVTRNGRDFRRVPGLKVRSY